MPEEKEKSKERKLFPFPSYLVIPDGGSYKLLVKLVGRSQPPEYLIRTNSERDLLDTILENSCANVYVAESSRVIVESLLGEALWCYGDEYKFGEQPKRKYPEPSPPATAPEEGRAEASNAATTAADMRICPKHNVEKLRNGCRLCRKEGTTGAIFQSKCPQHGMKHKSGVKGNPPRQRYKCPGCRSEKASLSLQPAADGQPPACTTHGVLKVKDGYSKGRRRWRCLTCNPKARQPTVERAPSESSGLAAVYAAKVKDNPPCETCGERTRVARRVVRAEDGATVTYWHCTVTGCKNVHKPTVQELSGEELERRLTAAVTSANGHDPQNRKDVVNELVRRILAKEVVFAQAMKRETIRAVVKEINSLYQDKYGKDSPLPLDAPAPGKDGEESKETYADRLESRGMNPEEELMAKETEEDISS